VEQSEGGLFECRPKGDTFYMAHIHASCRRMLIRESQERHQDDYTRARERGTLLPHAVRQRISRRTGAGKVTRSAYVHRRAYPRTILRVIGGKLPYPRRPGHFTGRPPGGFRSPRPGIGAGSGYNTVPYLPVRPRGSFPKKKRASAAGTTRGYVLTHWISGE